MVKLTKSNLQQKWKGKPGCRAVSAQNCISASSPNANGRVAWTFFGLEFYTTTARCTCFDILASSPNANGRVAWTFFGLEVVVFTQLQQDVRVLRSWYFEGWHAPCPWKQERKMIISSNYKFDPFFSVVLAFVVKAKTMDASNFKQSFEKFVLVLFVGILCL